MKPYYDHGGITIYHGDCRDVLPTLHPDVILTDPPYGIGYVSSKVGVRWHSVKGSASWQGTPIEHDDDCTIRDWLVNYATGTPMLMFGTWKVNRPPQTKAVLIWDKGPAFGMGDLSVPWKPSWEEIYVIGDGFTGSRDEGVIKGLTGVSWESRGRAHPTEKPVRLLQYLIGKCPDGLIVDPFMGSGTTLRAAKDLGRRAIGIEIEEKYVEIAIRRLQQEVLL